MTWWAIVFTFLTFYAVAGNRQRAAEGQKAHDALCVLRGDLDKRFAFAVQFLEDNPQGIPGISPATLRSSLRNQEATLEALVSLDCPPPDVLP